MKKLIGLFLCLLLVSLCAFALADVPIDAATFPDNAFREYVKKFDMDGNDSFSDAELVNVSGINCSYLSISDLKGIEHFTALQSLICSGNQLTDLDISSNYMLTYLDCGENNLSTLNIDNNPLLLCLICNCNQLTSLDAGHCVDLYQLLCMGNQLTTLNISNCADLDTLSCYENQLTALNTSGSPALSVLECDRNQIVSLDLSGNTSLTQLICFSNRLTSIDVSKCTALNKKVKEITPKVTAERTVWEESFPEDGSLRYWLDIDTGVKVITDEGVYGGDSDPVPVSSVALNKKSYTLTRTSAKTKPTVQLKATVSPENATDPSVEWSSSNPKVAKVDQKGKVTALKKGTAVITCQAKDGSGAKATCKITVKDKLISKITLNKTKATIKKGKTLQLKVKTIKPSNAFNQKVKWTSSNKKIATVDKNGKVKALKKGTCYITCTAADGSKVKVKCKITVK